MLSTDQKETILRKAGIAVPARTDFGSAEQLQQADGEPIVKEHLQADCRRDSAVHRARAVDALFAAYSAQRAVRSLQADEEARQAASPAPGWGGPTA